MSQNFAMEAQVPTNNEIIGRCFYIFLECILKSYNGPFAASGHMEHAGGQAAHWVIQCFH